METVNVLGKRMGHEPAADLVAYLEQTPSFWSLIAPKRLGSLQWEMFKKQPAAVSFTDCIVMAVADENATKSVFGLDTDHERSGDVIFKKALPKAA